MMCRIDGGAEGKDVLLAELEKKRTAHLKLFDRGAHQELVHKGIRQFDFEATMACVFVQTFANELVLQVGFPTGLNGSSCPRVS